jgi:hypothetical protein
VSSVSNGLYFLTLPLVSVMRVIKRNIEKVWGTRYTLGTRYLYIIRDAEKVCGARYTLGARYLPKNTVIKTNKNKLHGLSPRANYAVRATAACRRSDFQLLRIEGATWSA